MICTVPARGGERLVAIAAVPETKLVEGTATATAFRPASAVGSEDDDGDDDDGYDDQEQLRG
jgi:hypothetical protein